MSNSTFTVRDASWETDYPALKHIRETVFVEEQDVPLALEWDGEDERAFHVLAEAHSGAAIGTARMLTNGHIGRMAVLQEHRQQGVGRALLTHLLSLGREQQLPKLVLNAQLTARGFYEKFGFEQSSDVFDDAGISHIRMILMLNP